LVPSLPRGTRSFPLRGLFPDLSPFPTLILCWVLFLLKDLPKQSGTFAPPPVKVPFLASFPPYNIKFFPNPPPPPPPPPLHVPPVCHTKLFHGGKGFFFFASTFFFLFPSPPALFFPPTSFILLRVRGPPLASSQTLDPRLAAMNRIYGLEISFPLSLPPNLRPGRPRVLRSRDIFFRAIVPPFFSLVFARRNPIWCMMV